MSDRVYRVLRTFVILVMLTGTGCLCYPVLANWWNNHYTSQLVSDYNQAVDTQSDEDLTRYFEDAEAFNEQLLSMPGRFLDAPEDYAGIFDVSGTGMIGTVYVPSIGLTSPFYHGNSDAVLQVAAGHMPGTSFPIEGETTHGVIAAHTGMAEQMLFTGLDKMQEGDTFFVRILNREYTYTVSRVLTVLPEEMEALDFMEGENLCTLLTCTPLGVNSHRLLVTGKLTESRILSKEARSITPVGTNWIDLAAYGIFAVFGLVLVTVIIVKIRKYRKRKSRAYEKETTL